MQDIIDFTYLRPKATNQKYNPYGLTLKKTMKKRLAKNYRNLSLIFDIDDLWDYFLYFLDEKDKMSFCTISKKIKNYIMISEQHKPIIWKLDANFFVDNIMNAKVIDQYVRYPKLFKNIINKELLCNYCICAPSRYDGMMMMTAGTQCDQCQICQLAIKMNIDKYNFCGYSTFYRFDRWEFIYMESIRSTRDRQVYARGTRYVDYGNFDDDELSAFGVSRGIPFPNANADFDGDKMNVQIVKTSRSRSSKPKSIINKSIEQIYNKSCPGAKNYNRSYRKALSKVSPANLNHGIALQELIFPHPNAMKHNHKIYKLQNNNFKAQRNGHSKNYR